MAAAVVVRAACGRCGALEELSGLLFCAHCCNARAAAGATDEICGTYTSDDAERGDLVCSRCTLDEAQLYYCPGCLSFTGSPYTTVHRGRCKKCFECPVCQSPLAFHAVGATIVTQASPPTTPIKPAAPTPQATPLAALRTLPTASTPVSSPSSANTSVGINTSVAGGLFYVSCPFCRYSSLDECVGLPAQPSVEVFCSEVIRREDDPELTARFTEVTSRLKEHEDYLLRTSGRKFTSPARILRMRRTPATSAIPLSLGASPSPLQQNQLPLLPPPQSLDALCECLAEREETLRRAFPPLERPLHASPPDAQRCIGVPNLAKEATLSQQLCLPTRHVAVGCGDVSPNPRAMLPQRRRIRSVHTQSCPTCRMLLLRPDPKNPKKPNRQQLAWNYVPHVGFVQPRSLAAGGTEPVTLVLTNPTATAVWISLAAPPVECDAESALEVVGEEKLKLEADAATTAAPTDGNSATSPPVVHRAKNKTYISATLHIPASATVVVARLDVRVHFDAGTDEGSCEVPLKASTQTLAHFTLQFGAVTLVRTSDAKGDV
eukprot:TRINITY_DN1573_c0_g1_i5.p1 TRINITY_DN1573_c0_g1~~TRINITY_DN1573_c0_g1_i5.p1  ORF type:complete len:561 (+),score=114.33 TRINITY_DN1573_c0_g1_i5:42-1685(+)